MGLKLPLGKHIYTARLHVGMSVTELAKKVGVSKTHISRIENERNEKGRYPSTSLIHKISRVLNSPDLFNVYLERKFPELKTVHEDKVLFNKAKQRGYGNAISDNYIVHLEKVLVGKISEAEAVESFFDDPVMEKLPQNNPTFRKRLQAIFKKSLQLYREIRKQFPAKRYHAS